MDSTRFAEREIEIARGERAELRASGAVPLTVFYDESDVAKRIFAKTAPFPPSAHERVAVPLITLLVVDDNDDLRQIMGMYLEMMGYAVVLCDDASLASEAFRSDAGIDLLITDLQMPGRSGMELARELTLMCPSLPVLIVSGSILSGDHAREMRDRRWKFLAKPYDLPALLADIEMLLRPIRQCAA